MNQQHNQPSISMTIDIKQYRIRIHKNTLHALGDPKRIQLLLHPSESIIMVRSPQKGEPYGQEERVVFDKPGNQGTFQLYSKELINRIQRIYPCFENNQVYRLYGTLRPELHAASFSFDDMQSAAFCKENCHDTVTDYRSGIQGSHTTSDRS